MGYCDIDVKKDTGVKNTEEQMETKPKEKIKNNSYENIKHIVLGKTTKVVIDRPTQTQMKNKISIGL